MSVEQGFVMNMFVRVHNNMLQRYLQFQYIAHQGHSVIYV